MNPVEANATIFLIGSGPYEGLKAISMKGSAAIVRRRIIDEDKWLKWEQVKIAYPSDDEIPKIWAWIYENTVGMVVQVPLSEDGLIFAFEESKEAFLFGIAHGGPQ